MLNDKILRALGSQATEPATSFLVLGIGVPNTSRRRVLVVGAQIVVLDHLTVVALWFLPILLELIFHRYFLESTDFLELWLHEVLFLPATPRQQTRLAPARQCGKPDIVRPPAPELFLSFPI